MNTEKLKEVASTIREAAKRRNEASIKALDGLIEVYTQHQPSFLGDRDYGISQELEAIIESETVSLVDVINRIILEEERNMKAAQWLEDKINLNSPEYKLLIEMLKKESEKMVFIAKDSSPVRVDYRCYNKECKTCYPETFCYYDLKESDFLEVGDEYSPDNRHWFLVEKEFGEPVSKFKATSFRRKIKPKNTDHITYPNIVTDYPAHLSGVVLDTNEQFKIVDSPFVVQKKLSDEQPFEVGGIVTSSKETEIEGELLITGPPVLSKKEDEQIDNYFEPFKKQAEKEVNEYLYIQYIINKLETRNEFLSSKDIDSVANQQKVEENKETIKLIYNLINGTK